MARWCTFNEKTTYDPGTLTPPGAAAIVANPALATTADNARVGGYVGARFGYANGALDIALAYAMYLAVADKQGVRRDQLTKRRRFVQRLTSASSSVA
jgi:hypothetical protein